MLLRPGSLGAKLNVAVTGVEFEGLVLVLGGVAINVDCASLLSRRFSRGVLAVDDVDARSICPSS